MIDFFKIIGEILDPITKMISGISSDDNKTKIELENIRSNLNHILIKTNAQYLHEQSEIIQSEVKGTSWLQRNWRPITMLTFLVLIVADALTLLPKPLHQSAWTLLQIGLGGYIIGRSAEKIVPSISKQIKTASKN